MRRSATTRAARALSGARRATSRCRSSATAHGNVVHLFERDCSVQRRHQKVIEEAPAPALSARAARGARRRGGARRARDRLRQRRHGRVPDGERRRFYFMEMNTRLQVEHPVTEMVTGRRPGRVAARVAAGEPLPLRQQQIALSRPRHRGAGLRRGSASAAFCRPRAARRTSACPPRAIGAADRDGRRRGDAVSPFYDPMLAKIVAWGAGPRRGAAPAARGARRDRDRRAGDQSRVPGDDPALRRVPGRRRRHVIRRGDAAALLAPAPTPDEQVLAIASLWLLCRQRRAYGGRRGGQRGSAFALEPRRRLAAQ